MKRELIKLIDDSVGFWITFYEVPFQPNEIIGLKNEFYVATRAMEIESMKAPFNEWHLSKKVFPTVRAFIQFCYKSGSTVEGTQCKSDLREDLGFKNTEKVLQNLYDELLTKVVNEHGDLGLLKKLRTIMANNEVKARQGISSWVHLSTSEQLKIASITTLGPINY